MDKGTFDKLIASPVDISSQEVSQLEDLLASFPYCQVAHLLVAKESHDKKSMLYPQKLRKASTYALDRRVLYNVINRKTYQEKVVVHAPIVSVPEKKTTYESPPKSVNNQNSSFLRELEDNLKLLKEQTKKHDFTEVETPTPVKEEIKLGVDSDIDEKAVAANSMLESQALDLEVPTSQTETVEVIAANSLLDVSNEKEDKAEPEELPIALASESETNLPLEQATEAAPSLAPHREVKNVVEEPAFHPFDKEENLSVEYSEEKGKQIIAGVSIENQDRAVIIKDHLESRSLDAGAPEQANSIIVANRAVSSSESDYSGTENDVAASLPIPQSSDQGYVQSTDNSIEKEVIVERNETVEPLPELLPITPPAIYSMDLPQPTIVETKLGSELSFEASSGTEELELFLSYLRKNAPVKAPIEDRDKIIEMFIENKPKITRHSNVNFGQNNEDLAKSSISLRTELVTENYANILVKQNNIVKAIEVYKKLILKNPDKSAYFAAKLYELQSR